MGNPKNFRKWQQRTGQTVAEVSRGIGDHGGQLAKWVTGSRPNLPIALVVSLSNYTGCPLSAFATPEQMKVARELFAVMARDAAA